MDTKESNNDSAAPDVQLGTYLQEQPQQEQEQVQLQTQPQPIPSQVQIPLQEEAAVPEAVAVQAEVAVTPLPQSTVQPVTVQPDAYEQPMNGEQARTLAQNLIHTYFYQAFYHMSFRWKMQMAVSSICCGPFYPVWIRNLCSQQRSKADFYHTMNVF